MDFFLRLNIDRRMYMYKVANKSYLHNDGNMFGKHLHSRMEARERERVRKGGCVDLPDL